MSANSSIEWTDRTWNPVRGCAIVSPGCVNCYAMKQAHRFSGKGKAYEGLTKQTSAGPQWTGKVTLVESALLDPLKWRKAQRVFVNSMSDLFHESVPDEFIDRVFAVMALSPRHTFQILTKRPERMRAYLTAGQYRDVKVADTAKVVSKSVRPFALPSENIFDGRRVARGEPWIINAWPLPNVWLGVSCEDQQRADERIPDLLQTHAAVRFVSAEPLIGPIDVKPYMPKPMFYCSRCGNEKFRSWCKPCGTEDNTPTNEIVGLDWVIAGGESGSGARPCDVAWIRATVSQCRKAGVKCFVKQLGARPVGLAADDAPSEVVRLLDANGYDECEINDALADGRVPRVLRDRKGADPSEWPRDLRVQEWPS